MPPSWILRAKLTPPARPPGLLDRPRLGGSGAPVALIAAGPGFGKTMALVARREAAQAAGAICVWLTADELDADAGTFFQHLAAALSQHGPALDLADLPPRQAWARFFEQIEAYDLPRVALFLDDFHHVVAGAPAVAKGLSYCFDKLPPGVAVAIALRGAWPEPTARWITRGQLELVGPEALRLDADELDQLEPDPVWRRAVKPLDGWPLGVGVALTERTRARDAGWVERLLVDAGAEQLEGVAPARRRTLAELALLAEISPASCRAALGLSEPETLLAELEAEHMLTRLADGETFRLPGHLAARLERDLAGFEAAALARVHRLAGSHFEAAGQPALALGHLIAARDWPGAHRLGAVCVPLMVATGRAHAARR
ncbi:MAG: hypothetical protein JWM80_5098, partial [Cyanobacteria bacterium RYN_339]|nr:hypothetical protein [Cyanobacteria bacterium RYN_339]